MSKEQRAKPLFPRNIILSDNWRELMGRCEKEKGIKWKNFSIGEVMSNPEFLEAYKDKLDISRVVRKVHRHGRTVIRWKAFLIIQEECKDLPRLRPWLKPLSDPKELAKYLHPDDLEIFLKSYGPGDLKDILEGLLDRKGPFPPEFLEKYRDRIESIYVTLDRREEWEK